MTAIEAERVTGIDVAHHLREVFMPRVDHDVIVVVHQAVGQRRSIEAVQGLPDQPEESAAIVGVGEDSLAIVAAGRDVVDAACSEVSGRSRHVGRIGVAHRVPACRFVR